MIYRLQDKDLQAGRGQGDRTVMFILRVLYLCVLAVKIGGLVRIQANGVGKLFVANTFHLSAFFL